MNIGTCRVKPVSRVASLVAPVAVLPLTALSMVSTTSNSIFCGSWAPIALLIEEPHRLGRHIGLLHLGAGANGVVEHLAGDDALQLEAHESASLARLVVSSLHNRVELSIQQQLRAQSALVGIGRGHGVDKPLPMGFALSVTSQVAGALDHNHLNGVVLGDVKPCNILITDTGSKLRHQPAPL